MSLWASYRLDSISLNRHKKPTWVFSVYFVFGEKSASLYPVPFLVYLLQRNAGICGSYKSRRTFQPICAYRTYARIRSLDSAHTRALSADREVIFGTDFSLPVCQKERSAICHPIVLESSEAFPILLLQKVFVSPFWSEHISHLYAEGSHFVP